MPYIGQDARRSLDARKRPARSPGELNYQITMLIVKYVQTQGASYGTYNEAIGVLECAKLELYRRQVGPYEDEKLDETGDVYS